MLIVGYCCLFTVRCGGCGSKVGANVLSNALRRVKQLLHGRPEVIAGIGGKSGEYDPFSSGPIKSRPRNPPLTLSFPNSLPNPPSPSLSPFFHPFLFPFYPSSLPSSINFLHSFPSISLSPSLLLQAMMQPWFSLPCPLTTRFRQSTTSGHSSPIPTSSA